MGDLQQFTTAESSFIRKEDLAPFPNGIDATIVQVTEHQFEGERRPKLVLHFDNGLKPLAANVTNAACVAGLFSAQNKADLIGKRICLYVDHMVRNAAGQIVGGVRVRAAQQPQVQQPPQAPPPQAVPQQTQPPPVTEDEIPF